MAQYDSMLKGGTVLDPGAGLHDRRDIAIAGGRVAAIAADIPATEAAEVHDVAGLVVTPGLIDFHLHAFWGGTSIGLDVDRYCLPRGVTTAVDGGSAGAHNFLAFRRLVIDSARCRVLCFLNMATIGQVDVAVGELSNMAHVDPDAAARCIQENRDVILGLKVRLSRDAVGENSLRPLQIARDLADRLSVPIMVHIGDSEAPLPDILALLRGGDIVTHILTPRGHGAVDEQGRILPALQEAVARGVLLDVAQGRMHLSFPIARTAIAAGLAPHTLSTDVTIISVRDTVRDLPHTMSRFMALGMSLEQVVERTTIVPARIMGRETEIGTLQPGAVADVAAFALEEGAFTFGDSTGEEIVGRQRLVPRLVLRAGQFVPVQEIE